MGLGRQWTDAERIADAEAWAEKERHKRLKQAREAKDKEQKAHVRVVKAKSKIQLESAKTSLRLAKTRRLVVEANAKAALVNAKVRLDNAKAASVRASEAKWKARAGKISATAGGLKHLLLGGGSAPPSRTRKPVSRRRVRTTPEPTMQSYGYSPYDYPEQSYNPPSRSRPKKRKSSSPKKDKGYFERQRDSLIDF